MNERGDQGAGAQWTSAVHSVVPPPGGGVGAVSSSSESLLLQAVSKTANDRLSAHASLRAWGHPSVLLRIIVSYRLERVCVLAVIRRECAR
ncbi:hypothetical protein [Bordetella genomosp. 4]|uniref:hypothetical protein n=1 Tax=Bordetella genomosp. 4 TaxID=463044 RepID=UPI0011786B31|nr:hypothetical protein [Bordetella genomosp. 4]